MIAKYSKCLALNLVKLSFVSAPFCCIAAHADHTDKFDFLMAEANHQINSEHDKQTSQRFTAWENLIHHSLGKTEEEKIKLVNDFFNRMNWVSDKELWNKKDYWATPIESLIRNAGDCEDFSIAKYFTLLALDVPAEQLRISYVKMADQQNHMVLSYYPTLDSTPIILDNFNKKLLKKSERLDLTFMFSFNSDGLWLSDNKMIAIDDDNSLNHWISMMRRIEKEQG
ncbi:MAG: transglutaminase-like cysteine peptidase [Gammaproteobacteria bacterium]|nr:transglutaminase-like cysteine peptidase [Gammaproteobacteria bacterium]